MPGKRQAYLQQHSAAPPTLAHLTKAPFLVAASSSCPRSVSEISCLPVPSLNTFSSLHSPSKSKNLASSQCASVIRMGRFGPLIPS